MSELDEIPRKERDQSVSFVIPALNESAHIARAIASIRRHAGPWLSDLIVVDHGSSDKTPEIATETGATVIDFRGGTIGSARNRGVQECTGTLLVFIDADVSLTPEWANAFPKTWRSLQESSCQVTGSRCLPEARNDFLTRFWFSRLPQSKARYVNSGHLITSSTLFETLNGFDDSRHTAEDHDFCMRAKAVGAHVFNQPELRVVHHDYPATFRAFVAREAWHGIDDFKDWQSLKSSSLGLLVCANLVFLLFCMTMAIALRSAIPLLLYLAMAILGLTVLTLHKFGREELDKLPGTAIAFAAYMLGRTLALVSALNPLSSKKSSKD